MSRPDFYLGTDDFHTSTELVGVTEAKLQHMGYSTVRNEPFSGTIVPLTHYRKDQRVQSQMIKINRELYLKRDYSVDPVKNDDPHNDHCGGNIESFAFYSLAK